MKRAKQRCRRRGCALTVKVQYVDRSFDVPSVRQFTRWLQAALYGVRRREVDVTVRIVNASEGQALNLAYRQKDYATNVLTFVLSDDDLLPDMPLMGDIVLCAPVVAREAQERQIDLMAHYAHLTVHGCLHLRGFEHENDADAEIMERLESVMMTRLGYADPYRAEQE